MEKIQDYLEYPLIKGSILGAGVMIAATPGINSVVSKATGRPMLWSRPFIGCYSLAVSGAAANATNFTIKSMLGGDENGVSEWKRFWTASVAGLMSGVVLCPFESIAQTQLTTKMSLINTARTIYQYHGTSGFFRGIMSMMLREGAWASMYIAAVPIISQRLQKSGYDEVAADAGALLVSASIFGVVSSPINRARIMMQDKLAEAETPHKSYGQVLKNMLPNTPSVSTVQRTVRFFQGAGPRSITSALAGGLYYKGSQFYDEAIQEFKCIESKRI